MAVNSPSLGTVFSAIELLTVILSLFRMMFRLKIRRFWWEDMWAAVAMVGAVAFSIVNLIYFQTKSAQTARIATRIASTLFTSTIWSVRMSLLYSIVRLVSPSACSRNFTRSIGVLFVVVWASLVGLKTWWCTSYLKSAPEGSTCVLLSSIAIFEVVADFAGDATLVFLSLRLLWRIKLPRRQRRMILSIFSSSAIMSMISLPHAIAQIIHNKSIQNIFANVEFISSLVVCNLLVVVTYIYRVHSSSSESESSSEDDDFTTPEVGSTRSLTTVDVNISDPTTTGTTDHLKSGILPSLIHSAAS